MGAKHNNKSKQQQLTPAKDPRLEYLHSIGLTDKTAADLQPQNLDDFATTTANDFELIGTDVCDGFEYYRAVDDQSVKGAELKGYFALPKGTDVRYRGCHTDNEIMMVRTVEAGDAYRQAEHAKRAALRSGIKTGTKPMGGGAVYNESTEHSSVSVKTMER